MAKAPASARKAEPPKSNRERPDEPRRYEASKEELLKFYKDMLLIRRFEEKAGQLYGLGLIGGFCHLYIGQEAVAVGVQSALTDKDSVITGYRDQAPTRSSASAWRRPRRRPTHAGCRSIAMSAGSRRMCCRCR